MGQIDAAGAPRAQLVVHLDAIPDNVATRRRRVREQAPDALMMTVVKADGYGHGLVESARAARAGGADWVGVAVLEEALALRAAGDTGPLLAWLAVPGEDYTGAVEAEVDLTAYSIEQVAEIAAAPRAVGRRARLQLKIDTGLSRGGATEAPWPALVEAAADAEQSGAADVTRPGSPLAGA